MNKLVLAFWVYWNEAFFLAFLTRREKLPVRVPLEFIGHSVAFSNYLTISIRSRATSIPNQVLIRRLRDLITSREYWVTLFLNLQSLFTHSRNYLGLNVIIWWLDVSKVIACLIQVFVLLIQLDFVLYLWAGGKLVCCTVKCHIDLFLGSVLYSHWLFLFVEWNLKHDLIEFNGALLLCNWIL